MKLAQLTLRELFLLVVIAAMGCGWWVDRSRLRAAASENEALTDFLSQSHAALMERHEKLEEAHQKLKTKQEQMESAIIGLDDYTKRAIYKYVK